MAVISFNFHFQFADKKLLDQLVNTCDLIPPAAYISCTRWTCLTVEPDPPSKMVLPSTTSSNTAPRARHNNNPARQDRRDRSRDRRDPYASMTVQQRRTALLASFVTFCFLVVNWYLVINLTAAYMKEIKSEETSSTMLFLTKGSLQELEDKGSRPEVLHQGKVAASEKFQLKRNWILLCITMPLGFLALSFQLQCLPVAHD